MEPTGFLVSTSAKFAPFSTSCGTKVNVVRRFLGAPATSWGGGNCGHCQACREGDAINCVEHWTPGISYQGGYAESTVTEPAAITATIDGLRCRGVRRLPDDGVGARGNRGDLPGVGHPDGFVSRSAGRTLMVCYADVRVSSYVPSQANQRHIHRNIPHIYAAESSEEEPTSDRDEAEHEDCSRNPTTPTMIHGSSSRGIFNSGRFIPRLSCV
jgi:hypothetical protein